MKRKTIVISSVLLFVFIMFSPLWLELLFVPSLLCSPVSAARSAVHNPGLLGDLSYIPASYQGEALYYALFDASEQFKFLDYAKYRIKYIFPKIYNGHIRNHLLSLYKSPSSTEQYLSVAYILLICGEHSSVINPNFLSDIKMVLIKKPDEMLVTCGSDLQILDATVLVYALLIVGEMNERSFLPYIENVLYEFKEEHRILSVAINSLVSIGGKDAIIILKEGMNATDNKILLGKYKEGIDKLQCN